MLGFLIVIIGILDLLFLGVNYPFDISGLFVIFLEAIYIAIAIINSKSAIKSKNLSKTDKISLGFAGLSLVEMIVYLLTESKFVGNALGITLVVDGMLILITSFFPQIKKYSGLTKKAKTYIISKSTVSVISIVLVICLLGHNCVTNYEFFKHADDVKATDNIQQYEVKSVDDPFGWNNRKDGTFVPKNLKVNGLVTPSSLTPGAVSFSWISSREQAAFEIEIFDSEESVFSSGKIEDKVYSYKPDFITEAGKNYSWTLTLYDNQGETSENATSTFSTSIKADDWKAEWISADAVLSAPTKENRHNTSYFRTNLKVDAADIENGIDMYATAHGVYDIWINDVHVDDWYMAPGFTQYSDVLQTQHYDISKYLKAGDNKMLVQVGDGWYR